jgi:hypothetical protein
MNQTGGAMTRPPGHPAAPRGILQQHPGEFFMFAQKLFHVVFKGKVRVHQMSNSAPHE